MSILNMLTKRFKQTDKHGGHLWCDGIRYQPRDVRALVMYNKHSNQRVENTVAFCMRCFANSAVKIDKETNFCHYCGSMGTCITIKPDEAEYLRKNINHVIREKQKCI